MLTNLVFEVKSGLQLNVLPGRRIDLGGAQTVSQQIGSSLPDGSMLYLWNESWGGYRLNGFEFGSWDDPGMPLTAGSGFWIFNAGATMKLSMLVMVDRRSERTIPAGLTTIGTAVPIAVDLVDVPGFVNDVIWRYSASKGEFSSYIRSWWFSNGQVGEAWLRWDSVVGIWANVPRGSVVFRETEGWFRQGAAAARWTQVYP